MDFLTTEKEKVEVKVCKPGGVPVYGRVSSLVAEHLALGKEVKGLRLWYRCASCQRMLRIEEEANHNATFHVLVKCDLCEEMIDRHQFIHHKRSTCPKLGTFCEWCSADMTQDEIQTHYDTCIGAKEAKSIHIYPFVPPLVNIQFPPESMAHDLVKLASKMATVSIGDKFPVEVLQKYKSAYGYKLFPTKEGDEEMAVANDSLERRHHHQLNQQKKILCKYFAKKLLAPQDKIKHFLQSYVLSRESEMMLNLFTPKGRDEGNGKPAGSSEVTSLKSRPSGMQPKQYTRLVHNVTGSLCRQDARRFEEFRRRQLMVKNVTKLNHRLSRKLVKEEQEFVIKEAVSLEKKERIGGMPPVVREGVKNTAPNWGDLGLVNVGNQLKGYRQTTWAKDTKN